MTINTSTEAVKAIIYGLRQLTNEWVASNAANLIEALLAERDCSEKRRRKETYKEHGKDDEQGQWWARSESGEQFTFWIEGE